MFSIFQKNVRARLDENQLTLHSVGEQGMLVSVLVAYCAASVVEWCIHKWLMHEPKWRVGKFHIAHHKEVRIRWCNCSNFSNIFILFFWGVVLVGLIWPTADNQLFTRVPWITTCLRGLSHPHDMHTCGAIRISTLINLFLCCFKDLN